MRVLHILPSHLFAIGGMEDFTRNLVQRLERHGMNVEVWHLPLRPGALLMHQAPVFKTADLPVITVSRYRFPCFNPRRLRHYDVVHVHGIGGITDVVALTWLWHRRPVLVSTHGGIFHTNKFRFVKQCYFRLVQPLIARLVSCYVACSVNDRDLFAPVAPRLELIENGVALFPVPLGPKNLRRWVWVGRWSRNKELPALFRAVAAARRQLPEVMLDVVGAPDDLTRADLENLAIETGLGAGLTIHQAVTRDDMALILGQATLTLSAARHEGFGLAVIEAMSAGCVPVVNDIPVFRRFIAESGVGRVCDYTDAESAANALVEVSRTVESNPQGAAEQAAHFASRYGWSQVEERWLALYQRFAPKPAHSAHATNSTHD